MRGGVEPGFAFGDSLLLKLLQFGQVLFALAAQARFLEAQVSEVSARSLEDVGVEKSGADGLANEAFPGVIGS